MSSRKKLTITLISAAVVVIVAVCSIVGVLAAQNQTVQGASFTVSYTAGRNVIADVSGGYALTGKPTGSLSNFSSTTGYTSLGTKVEIGSATTTPGTLGTIAAAQTLSATNALVFEFKFKNKSQYPLELELTVQTTGDDDLTAAELQAKNLVVKCNDGGSESVWTDAETDSFEVSGNALGGDGVEKVVYVYVAVSNPDYSVASTALTFVWDLSVPNA